MKKLPMFAAVPAVVTVLLVSGCSTPETETRSFPIVEPRPLPTVSEFTPEPLPPITPVTDAPADDSPATAGESTNTVAAATSTAPRVTEAQAKQTVAANYPNNTGVRASKSKHQGFSAWKVVVSLPTGGSITGWVDTASGVVYDWDQTAPPPVVVAAPATPNSTPSTTATYEDEDEDEDDRDKDYDDDGKDDDD